MENKYVEYSFIFALVMIAIAVSFKIIGDFQVSIFSQILAALQ